MSPDESSPDSLEFLSERGDCGRRRGDKIEVIECSSPAAVVVVVKTFSLEEVMAPVGSSASRRHAVRALAEEQCPVKTIYWTDEFLQGVCWAPR